MQPDHALVTLLLCNNNVCTENANSLKILSKLRQWKYKIVTSTARSSRPFSPVANNPASQPVSEVQLSSGNCLGYLCCWSNARKATLEWIISLSRDYEIVYIVVTADQSDVCSPWATLIVLFIEFVK